MKKELINTIEDNALLFGIDDNILKAFIEVESSGEGFDPKTGRILIQFEPDWFERKAPAVPKTKWRNNKIDVQSREWEAFEDAYELAPEAAMEATSIGLGQIMGMHYSRLYYNTVQDMWDDAKKGIDRQVWQICMFISTDEKLETALKNKDWHRVASLYNGVRYKELAAKLGVEPYDKKLQKAYNKYNT